MTQSTPRRKTAARSDPEPQRAPRRARNVPTSRVVRRTALHPGQRRVGGGFLGWGAGLTRAERERAQERLAIVGFSAVLAVVLLLVGGALAWNKLYWPSRPMLRVDGHTVTVGQYADILSYRENVLLTRLGQAQTLASQPTPADPSQSNFTQQFAQQQVQQIENQLSGLSSQLVDDLIGEQIIREEAAKRGLTASPGEVQDQLNQIVGYQDPNSTPTPAPTAAPATPVPTVEGATPEAVAAAPTAPAAVGAATAEPTAVRRSGRSATFDSLFRAYQRATGGTATVIRQDVETDILRRKLNDQLQAAVPDKQEEIHARHILVADDTAANAVLQRLSNGESFEALAAELSTDPGSKDKGGDLGWFPKGIMIPEFEVAAFQLQPGQTSAPVKSSFGVHIIQVVERDPNHDVDPQILSQLKQRALDNWLTEAKKEHQIQRLDDSQKIDWAVNNGRKPSHSALG